MNSDCQSRPLRGRIGPSRTYLKVNCVDFCGVPAGLKAPGGRLLKTWPERHDHGFRMFILRRFFRQSVFVMGVPSKGTDDRMTLSEARS